MIRYLGVRSVDPEIHIVSAQRNSGDVAIKCLDSVFIQDYDRRKIRHIYIDDASTDGTADIVRRWMDEHPGHSVELWDRETRLGGTRNTLEGIRAAAPGSIVVELNGDDWLPDPGVFSFLGQVYSDPDVWMTYNSLRVACGHVGSGRAVPRKVIRENSYRKARWCTSHLHTFRAELFGHLDENCMIDPKTGELWSNADDQALYFTFLELCGTHARHIHRVMYVYNVRDDSEFALDGSAQADRSRRIREISPYQPLDRLDPGAATPAEPADNSKPLGDPVPAGPASRHDPR